MPPRTRRRGNPNAPSSTVSNANRILYSDDCLNVLNDEMALPTGSVDLIYLDPPFNSKSIYNLPFAGLDKDTRPVAAFADTWTWGAREDDLLRELNAGPQSRILADIVSVAQRVDAQGRGSGGMAAYLLNMAVRLLAMRRVLAPTGSIYLHCDDTAVHYLKLVMDAVFGAGNFRTDIIWKRAYAHSDGKQGRKQHGRIHDVLLFYTKGDDWTWNPVYMPHDKEYVEKFYKFTEEGTGRRYQLTDLTGPYGAAKGNPRYEVMGVTRYWRYSQERMQGLIDAGRVIQTKPGTVPRYKRYLDEMPGVPLQDVWTDIGPIPAQARERLGYPTQKPLALLERIIAASCPDEGLVLDPFCGCGTAVHAAETLGRRWLGVDISTFSVGLMRGRILRNFPNLTTDDVLVRGVPINVADAEALAARDKFEFEKWVCGAIGAEGMFHDPGTPGADGGVDGVLKFYPFRLGRRPKPEFALVQVKGGNVTPDAVKALKTDVDRFGATAGVMVCFNRHMRTVENQRGSETFSDDAGTYPVIQGLSVEDLLADLQPDLPLYGRRAQGGRISSQAEMFNS